MTWGLSGARIFVMTCSIAISTGLTAIASLALIAFAFAQAITIRIPLVATFHGFSTEDGAHAVAVQGSWIGAGGVVLLLAAPLCAVAIGYRDGGG